MGGYYFRGLWYYLNVNAISIGCSILISTQIAPNFKKIISLILAIIGVILGLVSFYKYASIQYINNESIDFYFKCFYIGSTYIFGSIAGYKFCHDEKKQ